MEVKRTTEEMESIWVVINNDRIKIRIGLLYLPQEKDQNLKEIYSIIKEQVEEAGKKDESTIILGDLNCKVGEIIKGNNRKISKGGKKMMKFIEKQGLVMANSLEVCEGLWTRDESNIKSVLDYVLVDSELSKYISKMKIYDDSREISPFHLKRENAMKIRTIYSDHNPIIVETNLVMKQIATEESRRRRVMTDEGKLKYNKELKENKVSQIWDGAENLQETYVKWWTEVERIKTKNEQVRKLTRKRKSKTMRLLLKEKKKQKNELRLNKNEDEMAKLNDLKRRIVEEETDSYYRRLMKTCEEITRNGRFDSSNFLKVKKRMEKKRPEENHAVLNKDGVLVTEVEEILKCYEEYYEDLLTTTNKRIEEERESAIVKAVEEKFNRIMEEGRKQKPKKTDKDTVTCIVKGLKRKKARDNDGWNNEVMIDGGDEMVDSLVKMTDMVQEKAEIPKAWKEMTIKSTHKKEEKERLTNKRGLFLTNVVSKAFETVVDKSNSVKFDILQNGGTLRRGIVDNWIVLQAQIDEGKRLKKPVYLFFADLVKCFDRLWLKDCINDLHDCGMREREASIIYKLNEEATFKVSTPAGLTNEVHVKEIVKQGTVFGPKLCCASTGKINEGIEMEEVLYPSVSVKASTYVDDILGGGRREFVQAVMEKCKENEKEKMWEISIEKSKWMCLKNGKRNVESIEVDVKQGRIGKAICYKYLGSMVNEKGNLDDHLKLMESKAIACVRDGKKMCCEYKIGKHEVEAKVVVYKMLVEKSVYDNIEARTNFRKSDIEKMESIQGQALKGLVGLPKTTPNWGLLFELDVWPIMLRITYKRMMLYHNLINSDDNRVAKHIVKAQERSGHEECLFGNMKRESKHIGIELNEELVKGKLKSEWKEEVKEKINIAIQKIMKEKREGSRKMRFLEKKGSETYLLNTWNEDARMALKIRLNMIEWIGDNVGEEVSCPLCGEHDTTEHVFVCGGSVNETGVTVKDLEEGQRMKEIVELFAKNEQKRRQQLEGEIMVRFDVLRREGTL